MTILIDIGNSRTKHCRLNKEGSNLFTQVTTINNEYFNEHFFDKHFSNAHKVIVANVASTQLTTKLEQWCSNHELTFIEVKSEQQKAAVISAYEKPQQLGVDRWLTLLAAAQLYPNKNVLIIDAGTATTVDLLAASGQHLGGWILAGVSTLFSSILKETTNVEAKPADEASLVFGSNTTTNVNNACWAATVGLINEAIRQAEIKLGSLDEVIITGGNSVTLQNLVSSPMTRVEDLVFYGLNSYN